MEDDKFPFTSKYRFFLSINGHSKIDKTKVLMTIGSLDKARSEQSSHTPSSSH